MGLALTVERLPTLQKGDKILMVFYAVKNGDKITEFRKADPANPEEYDLLRTIFKTYEVQCPNCGEVEFKIKTEVIHKK